MDKYLVAVDLPRSAATNLFDILDKDKSGTINVNEFVEGCLRLRGLPRAADIAQLLCENRKWQAKQQEWFTALAKLSMKCKEDTRYLRRAQRPESGGHRRSSLRKGSKTAPHCEEV